MGQICSDENKDVENKEEDNKVLMVLPLTTDEISLIRSSWILINFEFSGIIRTAYARYFFNY